MRVGLLTADLGGQHGWGRYGAEVARALQRQGADVTVITSDNADADAFPDVLRVLPAVQPLARGMLLRQMGALAAVRRALRGCDVIHNTVELFAALAWQAAGGRPLFHTLHGTYTNLPRMRRWPLSALYARALRAGEAVCVSQFTASVAREVLPGIAVHVVPNAVDAARFAVAQPRRTGRLIMSSGGVKARKGTLELVRTLAEVRRHIPDARLVVVGRVPQDGYGRAVQNAIRTLGLSDAVALPGFVSEADLLDWYAQSDVFVLPSLSHGYSFEGFGLVQLEASAAGLPVITTHGSGAAEAVEDGVTGLVLPVEALADALPTALVRLLRDRSLAQQMGQAGILKAQRCSWDDVARELLSIYARAL